MDLQEIALFLLCSCGKVTPGCSWVWLAQFSRFISTRVVFFYLMKRSTTSSSDLTSSSSVPEIQSTASVFSLTKMVFDIVVHIISGEKESSLYIYLYIYWSMSVACLILIDWFVSFVFKKHILTDWLINWSIIEQYISPQQASQFNIIHVAGQVMHWNVLLIRREIVRHR